MNRSGNANPELSCPQRERVIDALLNDSAVGRRGRGISYSLATHLAQCPSCRRLADDLGQVTAILSEWQGQRQPRNLLDRANLHALRILRRVVRASEEARKLTHPERRRSIIPLLRQPIRRLGLSAAAALVLICFRAGWLNGWNEGRQLAQRLAQVHLERHVIHDSQEWSYT